MSFQDMDLSQAQLAMRYVISCCMNILLRVFSFSDRSVTVELYQLGLESPFPIRTRVRNGRPA
jgi:hypothetical protein